MTMFNPSDALEAFETFLVNQPEHGIEGRRVEMVRAKLLEASRSQEYDHIFYVLQEDLDYPAVRTPVQDYRVTINLQEAGRINIHIETPDRFGVSF